MSDAGKANLWGLLLIFVLIAALGVLDVIENVLQLINSSLTLGAPPLLLLVLVYGGILLLCVLIVGLLTPRGR